MLFRSHAQHVHNTDGPAHMYNTYTTRTDLYTCTTRTQHGRTCTHAQHVHNTDGAAHMYNAYTTRTDLHTCVTRTQHGRTCTHVQHVHNTDGPAHMYNTYTTCTGAGSGPDDPPCLSKDRPSINIDRRKQYTPIKPTINKDNKLYCGVKVKNGIVNDITITLELPSISPVDTGEYAVCAVAAALH